MTREELIKFKAYFPDLVKPCWDCEGNGKKLFGERPVDCWVCGATGIELNFPLVVQRMIEMHEAALMLKQEVDN